MQSPHQDKTPAGNRLVYKNIELDPAAGQVLRAGRPVALSPKERYLLAFLLTHRGQAFTREELLACVWDVTTPPAHPHGGYAHPPAAAQTGPRAGHCDGIQGGLPPQLKKAPTAPPGGLWGGARGQAGPSNMMGVLGYYGGRGSAVSVVSPGWCCWRWPLPPSSAWWQAFCPPPAPPRSAPWKIYLTNKTNK